MQLLRNTLASLRLACLLLSLAAAAAATTQDDVFNSDSGNLHPRIRGRVYKDDKIGVQVPASWQLALLRWQNAPFPMGAELRKGNYLLRLCTGCGQASGAVGGRFAEIALLVQPWAPTDEPSGPCGTEQRTPVTGKIERVDFWFRRDPGHEISDANRFCRQPETTDTVWYGSYFAERCSRTGSNADAECGGYFLHRAWLAKGRSDIDEMAFALTCDTSDLDRLPRRNDPELQQILDEAAAIVRSVRIDPPKSLPPATDR